MSTDILLLMQQVNAEIKLKLDAVKGMRAMPSDILALVYRKGDIVYDRETGEQVIVESATRGRLSKD